MPNTTHIVCFTLDEQRFGVRLPSVQRVVRAVKVTPVPHSPKNILGVVNVHGQIIPVINLRQRFDLPARDLELDDQLIIAVGAHRMIALWVDTVLGVFEVADKDMTTSNQLPPTSCVDNVAKLDGGLILINNPDAFLSIEEATTLDNALQNS